MNKIFITLMIVFCVGWSACKKVEKNVADYYPTVKTISAIAQADGSILVTGQVAPGDFPIGEVGFCLDTTADAHIEVNQVRTDVEADGSFTALYSGYSSVPAYYVRTWATNENGIGLGNVVSIGSRQLDTTTFACRPALNSVYLDGSSTPNSTIQYKDGLGQDYEAVIHCTYLTLTVQFGQYPVTGYYSTKPGNNERYVKLLYSDANNGQYELTYEANKVYVQEITAEIIEITVCRATVVPGYRYLTTRFRISR